MSQAGANSNTGSGAAVVETLTGNSGGPVGPDGVFNVDILGNNTTGIDIVGTPASNLLTVIGIASSETQVGTVELATGAETTTGTSTSLAVHPDGLNTKLGAQTSNGLIYGQGGAGSNLGSLGEASNGQLPIGSTGNPPVLATLTAGSNISIANGAGSITISANGGGVLAITSLNDTDSPYTVLDADEYLSCDVSSGILSIELPNAPTTGRVIRIKDSGGDANTNNISVTTAGGVVTIDGATTYTINADYQSISVIFNGTSYEVF